MIIAVVELPRETNTQTAEELMRYSLEATKVYHEVKGLRRKYFLDGASGGGGVYVFDTREDAEAWFHDGWSAWMEKRQGVRPILKIYDCVLTLDNEADEVRVGDAVVPSPWNAQAAE
ncbi:hypothetical protein L1787_13325 [Acuticoccus sp. M5D2P5]|uniref:hypothetical protein n=1 Tax=Acuticoccus kalidii TaxID=2910977 RepID=UPI001F1E03C0|nr:hypothetical protein [Acuticoccus kalidii]MCF3934387.1 hypothetical protein [Acuticoccus kalidii]